MFFLFALTWVFLADEIWQLSLIIPMLVVRSCYFTGGIKLPPKTLIVIWLMIYVVLLLIGAHEGDHSKIIFQILKMVVASIVIVDTVKNFSDHPLKRAKYARRVWLYFDRGMILLKSAWNENREWRDLAKRAKLLNLENKGNIFGRLKRYIFMQWRGAHTLLISSLSAIRKQEILIESRGDFPKTALWMHNENSQATTWWIVFFADVAFILLILFSLYALATKMLPTEFREIVSLLGGLG